MYMNQELLRIKDMAERYCDMKLKREEMKVIVKSMEIMKRLSERDNGSDELLRFGSMLVAERVKRIK